MAKKQWTFQLEDGTHTVELEHGTISGKREIRVDGQLLASTGGIRHLVDFGSEHPFRIGEHTGLVVIRTKGLTFGYDVVLDGQSLQTGKEVRARPPMPAWGWAFVVLCGLIPVVALGGAIPVLIGIGGALGCASIARDASKPVGLRAGLCVAVGALCWMLFIALASGVALLRS